MSFTIVADATHGNINAIPAGLHAAGYVTGSGDVPWTPDDWKKHPDAIRIDQTPASTPWDATADVDDMERGAVTLNELAGRAKLRMAAFKAGTRPGQRSPVVYASASSITPVVNALIAGGVTSGVGLWVANWNLTQPQAIAEVTAASGPFPIRGIQYTNQGGGGSYDLSVFDAGWLDNRSGKPSPVTPAGKSLPAPPGEWEDAAMLMGLGTDGHMWTSVYDFGHARWLPPVKAS
jgi:hypothetical protein